VAPWCFAPLDGGAYGAAMATGDLFLTLPLASRFSFDSRGAPSSKADVWNFDILMLAFYQSK